MCFDRMAVFLRVQGVQGTTDGYGPLAAPLRTVGFPPVFY
jgi:hypothetical protein